MNGARGALLAAALLLATTLSVPVPAADGIVAVQLSDDLRFNPADVTVVVNTTVRWQNVGTTAWHTVTAYEDRIPEGAPYFDSSGAGNETAARQAPPEGFLQPGDVFDVTFSIPGDYAYFCVPHEGAEMKGVVHVVEPLPEPQASNSFILILGLAVGAAAVAIASFVVLRRRRP